MTTHAFSTTLSSMFNSTIKALLGGSELTRCLDALEDDVQVDVIIFIFHQSLTVNVSTQLVLAYHWPLKQHIQNAKNDLDFWKTACKLPSLTGPSQAC